MPAEKILLIEDEEYIADMYRIKFEKCGYKVVVAEDGEKGLALAESERPDLVLLDLVLPRMDGYQVLEKIRTNKKTENLKVYIISNLGQNGEVDSSLARGADGYIIKSSLTPAQLLENVEKIFRGQSTEKNKIVQKCVPRNRSAIPEKKIGKVLLVEDEEAIIDMYKLRLTKEGFEVEVAKNGIWAVKLAKAKKFDIIIMDIIMPAMSGYEAVKQLKADKKTKELPIIVLSNSAQDNEIEEAKRMGVSAYFLKSQVTPSRLSEEVKKILKIN